MKTVITLICTICLLSIGKAQEDTNIPFVISNYVDSSSVDNKEIISLFGDFLNSKNSQYRSNKNWLPADFKRFVFPFQEIIGIEYDYNHKIAHAVNLMEIYDIQAGEKLVKFGYTKPDSQNGTSTILVIYNIIATKETGKWLFKRAVDYTTTDWQKIQKGSILYYLPPGKKANETEIAAQLKDIEKLSTFFNTEALDITYYSCNSPKQVFELKGFDYHPSMYISKTGGMAAYGNIIYSGNNSEFYTHEIVHVYISNLYPKTPQLLNEGIAMYLGGSGVYDYSWHREKFAAYIKTADIDLANHLQPYGRLYIDDETSVPYMVGALICEKVIHEYGKEYLFELFQSNEDILDILDKIHLNPSNLTVELKKVLKQR